MFGTGRALNGLLISPAVPITSEKDFINEIWATIVNMNKLVPAHSRVVKELVLIEDSRLPFAFTDKGTVRERVTLNLYSERIERAYEEMESKQSGDSELAFPTVFGKMEISSFLRHVLKSFLPDFEAADDADLFEHGEKF